MEKMKLDNSEPVVYIKEEHTNISALNPIDLNIQDEEDEIGEKSEHKVYCSLTVVNPEEITYDSVGSDDYNSDWVFGLSTDYNHSQQSTIKNNESIKNTESSQQSLIECDLSNDSTYSRLNDNSSSDNSNMYTYFSLPNESPLVSFSQQEIVQPNVIVKRLEFNEWSPEPKKLEPKKIVKSEKPKVEKSPVKKTHICPVCNKLFASKSNLERHGVVHSEVKPFQCPECNRTFSRKVHLERHKLLHSDEKPFNCEICKKGFIQKSLLLKHEYVHTGFKPFPCNLCEKSFARKETLKKHQLVHDKQAEIDKQRNSINQTSNIKKEPIEGTSFNDSIVYNNSTDGSGILLNAISPVKTIKTDDVPSSNDFKNGDNNGITDEKNVQEQQ